MHEPSDHNPSELRAAAPVSGGATTPQSIVDGYVAIEAERTAQLEIVDRFVDAYLYEARTVAEELAQLAPQGVLVTTQYSCTTDRARCILQVRFANFHFSFVHLREVAYFSFAPVPEEIAGQVALYLQEVPVDPNTPLGDGILVSSLFIYPVRKEWRFVWGMSAGALHPFDDVATLRDKILREVRSVVMGAGGLRRWPDMEQIARVPAEILAVVDRQAPSIGFLRPSLKAPLAGAMQARPTDTAPPAGPAAT